MAAMAPDSNNGNIVEKKPSSDLKAASGEVDRKDPKVGGDELALGIKDMIESTREEATQGKDPAQNHSPISLPKPARNTASDSNSSPADEAEVSSKLWSLKHAFWVGASGCVVRLNNSHDSTVVLTPSGITKLADLGLLPEITEEEISSRSKSDAFAKIIVVIQAMLV